MRRVLACLTLLGSAAGSLLACGGEMHDGDSGAAHIGAVVRVAESPDLTIDDEFGTDVRVFVEVDHMGGPDADTLEVVSASLGLDGEHFADLELAIPDDHAAFPGLADGESFDFELRGSTPDNHDDWGLCGDPQQEESEGNRVTVDLVLRVTPGANDEDDIHEFEAMGVQFHCSHTG